MRKYIKQIYIYLILLLRESITQFTVVIGIVTAILPLIFPNIVIPSSIYPIIALVGFILANFKIWQQQQDKLGASEKLEKHVPVMKNEIEISFLEGNNYNFSLNKILKERLIETIASIEESYDDMIREYEELKVVNIQSKRLELRTLIEEQKERERVEYKNDYRSTVPELFLDINTIIKNIGNVDLEIISIESEFDFGRGVWIFLPGRRVFSVKKEPLDFPIAISVNKQFSCIVTVEVDPRYQSNPAKFATILSSYSSEKVKGQIKLIARNERGLIVNSSKRLDISTKHFKEKYEEYWREEGKTELLRLLSPGTQSNP